MSDFTIAMNLVIDHEGKTFVNDPLDSGGATKFGLTLEFIHSEVDPNYKVEDLKNMSEDDARSIYLKYWWDKYEIWKIIDQDLSNKVFDLIINVGPNRGFRICQSACNHAGISLNIDGVAGPATIKALNTPNKSTQILTEIRVSQKTFYLHIVENNPSQKKFLKGWLSRAES